MPHNAESMCLILTVSCEAGKYFLNIRPVKKAINWIKIKLS